MTLPSAADVVIIGGGVMGASTAYHLALKGCRDVVLLERNGSFGMESTGKCAGGIRHQFDTEVNIRLSRISLRMLDRFEEETGQAIGLRKCGYLFILTRDDDIAEFQRQVRLQGSLGVETQWVDGDEIRRRLPWMNYPDALGGTWNSNDGLADPNSVVQGYIMRAQAAGVKCFFDCEVTGIRSEGGHVRAVESRMGSVQTPSVVNAAGPWAGLVGRMLGVEIPIVPVRRQIVVTTPIPELPSGFPFVIDFATGLYFHPEAGGLLTGMAKPDEPGGFSQIVDFDWEMVHLEEAMRRLPLLKQAGVSSRWAGLYENTPDALPVLGAVEERPGFYCIAGFSGHGFMHGPVCGQLVAEEVLDGEATTIDISSLRLSRFRHGPTIREYNVV
jgi:sarcosine oxidase subunit beta